jgi:hypothetical protein
VYENEAVTRISGAESEEVTGCWGKLHEEELHRLLAKIWVIGLLSVQVVIRWVEHVENFMTSRHLKNLKEGVKRNSTL